MKYPQKRATPATLTFWRRTALVCALFVMLSTCSAGLMVAGISERMTLSLTALIGMLLPLLLLIPQISDGEPPRPWQQATLVIMAGLATLMSAVVLVGSYLRSESAGITYETNVNESRSHQLADGTVIALGAQSELRVLFTHDRRVVQQLKGEVRFDVAEDAERPFIVTTFLADFALGTKFRVLVDSGVSVVVEKGIVRVHSHSTSPSIEVKAGSSFRVPRRVSRAWLGTTTHVACPTTASNMGPPTAQ